MDFNPVRWIFFLFCAGVFVIAALFNACVAWRVWFKDQPDGPSFAPIFFGVIGAGAVLMAPFGTLAGRASPWSSISAACRTLLMAYGIHIKIKKALIAMEKTDSSK